MAFYYYNGDEFPQIESDGSLTGIAASVSALEAFLEQNIGSKTGIGISLKLLLQSNITSTVTTEQIDIQMNDAGEMSIEGLAFSAFSAAAISAYLVEVRGASKIAGAAVGSAGLVFGVNEGIIAMDAIIDSFFDLNAVDVKFRNAAGEYREGVFIDEGSSSITETLAVNYFINHSSSVLTGGQIEFYTESGHQFGNTYNLYDGSVYQNVANLLGISLDAFLATGPTTATKNIHQYATNLDGTPFIFNADGNEMQIYIPVSSGSEQTTTVVNNIYADDGQGNHTLLVGDGDTFGTDTHLFIAESINSLSITGDQNDKNVIISDSTDHSLFGGGQDDVILGMQGNDSLFGNGGDDTLEGGADNDLLDGGEGADTFKFTGIYNNDVVSNTGDTDLTDDVIEIGGQVLEGFAAENASGSGWTLGEYALSYDNNLLKIAGSNGIITLSDWANDGEYGIQLEGSAANDNNIKFRKVV